MEAIKKSLISKLELIDKSDAFDPSEFKYVVSLLEKNVPEGLSGAFFDSGENEHDSFKEKLKQELLSADAGCKIDEDLTSCIRFFEIINLLKVGINKINTLPKFIPDRDKVLNGRMFGKNLHIDYQLNEVDNFIELSLYHFGHSHDPETKIGGLDDRKAKMVFEKLSCLWSENSGVIVKSCVWKN